MNVKIVVHSCSFTAFHLLRVLYFSVSSTWRKRTGKKRKRRKTGLVWKIRMRKGRRRKTEEEGEEEKGAKMRRMRKKRGGGGGGRGGHRGGAAAGRGHDWGHGNNGPTSSESIVSQLGSVSRWLKSVGTRKKDITHRILLAGSKENPHKSCLGNIYREELTVKEPYHLIKLCLYHIKDNNEIDLNFSTPETKNVSVRTFVIWEAIIHPQVLFL